MQDLSIGDVAKRAGVKPSTLRFYEDVGVLPPPRRVNGQRRYSVELVDAIQVARFAQSVGFSLAEISQLFRGFEGRAKLGKKWRPLAEAKLKELDARIAAAQQMKRAISTGLRCGCIRVEDCQPGSSKRSLLETRR